MGLLNKYALFRITFDKKEIAARYDFLIEGQSLDIKEYFLNRAKEAHPELKNLSIKSMFEDNSNYYVEFVSKL